MTEIDLLAEFELNTLICLGFGFGSIFWAIVLWIIFGRGK